MSDDSISSQVSDELKGIGKVGVRDATEHITPKVIFKEIWGQIVGSKKEETEKTPEEKAKEEAEKQVAANRITEIDAEIQRIAAERAKLIGPEIPGAKNENNTNEDLMQTQNKPQTQQNLQVTLAQTKGETGRGAKG